LPEGRGVRGGEGGGRGKEGETPFRNGGNLKGEGTEKAKTAAQ